MKAAQGYRDSFKASSLIGLSSFVNIVIGMGRTKVIAILLGPDGVGLMGLYTSILSFISTFFEMGIENSGIRQVAISRGTDNQAKITKTVSVLLQTSFVFGALGSLFLFLSADYISLWSFGVPDYGWALRFLSITIWLGIIAKGQRCLLQGMRDIRSIAKINIFSSLLSTGISLPCYYLWGKTGIVVSLILCAFAQLLLTYFYRRKIKIRMIWVSFQEWKYENFHLLKMGLSFMISGLLCLGGTYVVNIIVTRSIGLEGLGLYQAAAGCTAMIFNFIFNAMGTDFYPKLAAISFDRPAMITAIKQQTEISILLSLPIVVGMLFFAPLGIRIFYTEKFLSAGILLQVLAISCFFQTLSFPIGYIIPARGLGKIMILKTLFNNFILNIVFCFVLVKFMGILGVAIAFLALCIVSLLVNLVVAFYVAGVYWDKSVVISSLSTLVIVLCSFFCTLMISSEILKYCIGSLVIILVGGFCLYLLLKRLELPLSVIFKLNTLFRKKSL